MTLSWIRRKFPSKRQCAINQILQQTNSGARGLCLTLFFCLLFSVIFEFPLPLFIWRHFVRLCDLVHSVEETRSAVHQIVDKLVDPDQLALRTFACSFFNEEKEVLERHGAQHAVSVLLKSTGFEKRALFFFLGHLPHFVQRVHDQLSAHSVLHFFVDCDKHFAQALGRRPAQPFGLPIRVNCSLVGHTSWVVSKDQALLIPFKGSFPPRRDHAQRVSPILKSCIEQSKDNKAPLFSPEEVTYTPKNRQVVVLHVLLHVLDDTLHRLALRLKVLSKGLLT